MHFGLIGYPISRSFSRPYFTEKFEGLGLSKTHEYRNFEVEDISFFPDIINVHESLRGLNVTIPHKQTVMAYLDEIDDTAKAIGAVNTILIKNGKTKGFNTDLIGFKEDFEDFLDYRSSKVDKKTMTQRSSINIYNDSGTLTLRKVRRPIDEQALVLGTGGASLAIIEALKQIGIRTTIVSRKAAPNRLTYDQLNDDVINVHRYIINCTPLGATYRIDECPNIPYAAISHKHFCYDLVYNPAETLFMKKAKDQGAQVRNGMGMLIGQAEAAWKIWTA